MTTTTPKELQSVQLFSSCSNKVSIPAVHDHQQEKKEVEKREKRWVEYDGNDDDDDNADEDEKYWEREKKVFFSEGKWKGIKGRQ